MKWKTGTLGLLAGVLLILGGCTDSSRKSAFNFGDSNLKVPTENTSSATSSSTASSASSSSSTAATSTPKVITIADVPDYQTVGTWVLPNTMAVSASNQVHTPASKSDTGQASFTASELQDKTAQKHFSDIDGVYDTVLYYKLKGSSRSSDRTKANKMAKGRVGKAWAVIDKSLLPASNRTSLSTSPTGWVQQKISGHGGYLYNRSHVLAFSLVNENDNPANLFTGTRQVNASSWGMTVYEEKVRSAVKAGSTVRYEVTPLFKDKELVPRAVHMQAKSLTDSTVNFNVILYNVQDGVSINYQTGLIA